MKINERLKDHGPKYHNRRQRRGGKGMNTSSGRISATTGCFRLTRFEVHAHPSGIEGDITFFGRVNGLGPELNDAQSGRRVHEVMSPEVMDQRRDVRLERGQILRTKPTEDLLTVIVRTSVEPTANVVSIHIIYTTHDVIKRSDFPS